MALLELNAKIVVDTATMTATFVVPDRDVQTLVKGVNHIMATGGIRGLNPFTKAVAEGTLMNWTRDLIAKGWVSLIPDGKLWKIIIKKAS
jgi:hypothetical protein